jgi:hypothetical protein
MIRFARGLLAVAALVLLAGCRLDVDVGMTMNADGTGEIVVTATVDADVVAQAPNLADALMLPDAQEAGWTVEGPTATDDGGLTITLRHTFADAIEATNLLRSIGPPFNVDILVSRTASEDEIATALAGTASLAGGSFDAFADGPLVEAIGGVPFAGQLQASGATPAGSMSVEFTVRLPGRIEQTTGDRSQGGAVWNLPLDGSSTDLTTSARLRAGGGSGWAGPVATIALILLIAWLVAGIVFVVRVIQVRRRRRRRRRGGSAYLSNRYR